MQNQSFVYKKGDRVLNTHTGRKGKVEFVPDNLEDDPYILVNYEKHKTLYTKVSRLVIDESALFAEDVPQFIERKAKKDIGTNGSPLFTQKHEDKKQLSLF